MSEQPTVIADGWHRITRGDEVDISEVKRGYIDDGAVPVHAALKWGWIFEPVHVLSQAEYETVQRTIADLQRENAALRAEATAWTDAGDIYCGDIHFNGDEIGVFVDDDTGYVYADFPGNWRIQQRRATQEGE